MNEVVLDSAAVLALILKEPGGDRVNALLDSVERGEDVRVAISSVNWCEILSRLLRDNKAMTAAELAATLAGVELVPFGRNDAERASQLTLVDRSISLGDRACLSLARTRQAVAWTTDKALARMKTGVQVEVLR